MLNTIETAVCSRCGGSGRYSYCTMYGSVCFGCSGSGKKYTKRGYAALEYLKSLRCKPAREFKVMAEGRSHAPVGARNTSEAGSESQRGGYERQMCIVCAETLPAVLAAVCWLFPRLRHSITHFYNRRKHNAQAYR